MVRASAHPRGLAGSRPLVSGGAEWLSRPSGPEGQGGAPPFHPPTVCNLLLSTTIMVTPWPPGLIFVDDKLLWKTSRALPGIGAGGRSEIMRSLSRRGVRLSHGGERVPSTLPLSDLVWRHWQVNNWKTNKTTIPRSHPTITDKL